MAWFYFGVYHIREFSKDGTNSDKGFNSSRSHGHCRFSQMSLTEARERTFTFQGLPLVPLTLGLHILEPPIVRQSEYEVLTKLSTVVEATPKDSEVGLVRQRAEQSVASERSSPPGQARPELPAAPSAKPSSSLCSCAGCVQ